MRTLLRYLGGGVLVAALIVVGVVVGVVRSGSTDERAAADAIVVLGAAQYDGEPSAVFRARLDHAAELYRQGVAPRIVTVGGGQTGDRTTEGAAGADYLAADGIDRSALTAVGTGDDTLASLRADRRAAGPRTAGRSIMSSPTPGMPHVPPLMATDLGLSVQVSPGPAGPARSTATSRYALRAAGNAWASCTTGSPAAPRAPERP